MPSKLFAHGLLAAFPQHPAESTYQPNRSGGARPSSLMPQAVLCYAAGPASELTHPPLLCATALAIY